jgi:predicted transcriptional regulator of viral defense system
MNANNIGYLRDSQAERLLTLVKSQGTIRTREAIALDIHPEYLRRLVEKGILLKSGRGMYTYIDAELSENHSLALTTGIETHTIEGIPVQIFNPAKTIVDCFKYRHKIGLDVALEALRDVWESRRCSMDELWEYAKICRMSKVMRPYLEFLS